MERIVIEGGMPLKGTISIGGAKNSAVALIPAALLADGVCTIKNVPNITDRDALFDIVKVLNCDITQDGNVITIDSSKLENVLISQDMSVKLRASYYFMGVLLGKYKHVEMYFPGGCNIGVRPIDIHIKGFKALGAKVIKNKHKYIIPFFFSVVNAPPEKNSEKKEKSLFLAKTFESISSLCIFYFL